jgi:hypothetical protein
MRDFAESRSVRLTQVDAHDVCQLTRVDEKVWNNLPRNHRLIKVAVIGALLYARHLRRKDRQMKSDVPAFTICRAAARKEGGVKFPLQFSDVV